MTVICITVTQSSEQVVSGIPRTVSISTNIRATIFYTLDGTTPTLFSPIYTGPIFLPFNEFLVTLSILATDGVDYSPVVVEQYQTDIVHGNARLPHAATTAEAGSIIPDSYPYGTPPFQPRQEYLNPADSGVTVNDPSRPTIPNGYDGFGNPTDFTNKPYNTLNYQIRYEDRDAEGDTGYGLIGNGMVGPGIGNVPGDVTLPYPSAVQLDTGPTSSQGPEQTNQFTSTFDPRAMVIFQDFSQEDPNDPPQINRQNFTLEDPERARDGTYYYNTGLDASAPASGTFIRSQYNPRTNTVTYYYRDSWSNKWIISTAPFQPNGTYDGNLAQVATAFGGHVYEWLPFTRRVLF
jgi:hypothetical protein